MAALTVWGGRDSRGVGAGASGWVSSGQGGRAREPAHAEVSLGSGQWGARVGGAEAPALRAGAGLLPRVGAGVSVPLLAVACSQVEDLVCGFWHGIGEDGGAAGRTFYTRRLRLADA